MKLPDKINILGKEYAILYFDKIMDVDIYTEKRLFGQIDYFRKEIRVYVGDRSEGDVADTLMHEILHGLIDALFIDEISKSSREEEIVGLLGMGLSDTLVRNGFLSFTKKEEKIDGSPK